MFKQDMRPRLIIIGNFLGGSLALFLASFIPGFFNIYMPWSRTVSGGLGFLMSFVSFSVAELLLYGLILCLLSSLVRAVILSIRRTRGKGHLIRWFLTPLTVISAVLFCFLALWGLMYQAPPLEGRMGLRTDVEYSQEQLVELTTWLVGQINELAPQVPRDEAGAMDASFDELGRMTVDAMEELARQDDVLIGGIITRPKRISAYFIFDYIYISGFYSFYSGECNVNPNMAAAYLPDIMAHEMAHRLGFAPENDAGFVAFLACMASRDPEVRYSGAFGAFRRCIRQIEDPAAIDALYAQLTPFIDQERARQAGLTEYMNPGIARVTSRIFNAVNDAYLKSVGQQDGVQSYGRMVDLLLAWYFGFVKN